MSNYEAACASAATRQALDALSVLEDRYDYGVEQTGGFCMVGRVDTPSRDGFVWITFEGDGYLVVAYPNEDAAYDDGGTVLAENATVDQIPALLDAWISS